MIMSIHLVPVYIAKEDCVNYLYLAEDKKYSDQVSIILSEMKKAELINYLTYSKQTGLITFASSKRIL